MWNPRANPAALRGFSGVAILAALVVGAAGSGTSRTQAKTTSPDTLVQPEVGDTRANLQKAFDSEVNTKARYESAARIADREGYPYVARLFRACARAENVHATQHVHAIAWTGDPAKAFLERLTLGSTAENLKVAIDLETYEATRRYPAFLAQARAEGMTPAVRSMNYALAAEREHARLFTAALETLERRPAPRTFHVCPTCGKTTASLDFEKCPNCFTTVREFVPVD